MRRTRTAFLAALVAATFAVSSAWANGHRRGDGDDGKEGGEHTVAANHTITWWCTDLNKLWQVRFPVIAGIGNVTPPDPSPIPDPCQSAFPVVVPEGSRFMPGGTFVWYTNKTYPPTIRAALAASGYHFRSHNPMEDFLKKVVKVRVEIWSLDWSTLVADYAFDPEDYARVVQTRDFDGKTPEGPYSNPALGIDYTAEQMQRMPLVGFALRAGPLPEGTPTGMYWAAVFWTLSEEHNDGLNLEPGNFLPGGEEFLYGQNRFWVE